MKAVRNGLHRWNGPNALKVGLSSSPLLYLQPFNPINIMLKLLLYI
jgi:hypothetical protein